MGLWNKPDAMLECVEFIEREQARFAFIAVGSPQSEKIAYMVARRGSAVGVGFCVGAALEFLVGAKKRAPLWMQKLSLEWLYRMAADPKRLWHRYVYGAVPLSILFAQDILHGGQSGSRT
jgi:exopolysaccharide biosynthesis WecB/TagA/CpsF family protein